MKCLWLPWWKLVWNSDEKIKSPRKAVCSPLRSRLQFLLEKSVMFAINPGRKTGVIHLEWWIIRQTVKLSNVPPQNIFEFKNNSTKYLTKLKKKRGKKLAKDRGFLLETLSESIVQSWSTSSTWPAIGLQTFTSVNDAVAPIWFKLKKRRRRRKKY